MMQMEGWQDHLHFNLLGEHVLFPGLHLDSTWHFLVASILTTCICLCERALTHALAKNWSPFSWTRRSPLNRAIWRTALYWVVTFVRLLYMLVAMTFSVSLLVVTVTSLSLGQFFIEYAQQSGENGRDGMGADSENVKEPLLASSPTAYESSLPLHSHPTYRSSTPPSYPSSHRSVSSTSTYHSRSPVAETGETGETNPQRTANRPRSKSKPSKIFIHPTDSNLARADAAALQLGIGSDTDLVKGHQYPTESETPWKAGKGKDLARELLGRRSTID